MSPAQRVQCILRGADDSGQLATESDPEGFTRALLRKAPGGLKLKGKGGVLSMQRGLYDGPFVAQAIKPQARVLAESRGLRWVEVNYDELRGMAPEDLRLF